MNDSLFTREDDAHVRPTDLARGPWTPDALHGGPVAGLVAHLAESAPAPQPMHPARLTLELLRPVPLRPLETAVRVVRPGRKVQLVEVTLRADGTDVARALCLRLRAERVPLPAEVVAGAFAPPPGHEGAAPSNPAWAGELRAFHSHATEHRVVRGAWGEPGPCTDWIRLRAPLFPDATDSPFVRVAALADFGNGIGSALPFSAWRFVNADLTIHLHRLPAGDWVCLDAATFPDAGGVAVAESLLSDEHGRLGRALQSLLVEKR